MRNEENETMAASAASTTSTTLTTSAASTATAAAAATTTATTKYTKTNKLNKLNTFGGPFGVTAPQTFRNLCRTASHTSSTNGICPGFLQCNMIILPLAQASDFLLYCQRNPKALPLVDVLDEGCWKPNNLCKAATADVRTDLPGYRVYDADGAYEHVTDITGHFTSESVTFFLGCSFTFEHALIAAGIQVRSVANNTNVPMYRTNVKCREAGMYRGNMVVSMRPFHKDDVARVIEITDKYTQAHGGPVHCGDPSYLGIAEINKPDYGEKVDVLEDEVCCFWACGVTGIEGVIQSGLGGISHMPGGMFVTDVEM
jgi:uncharacterized protein YcsI (UPF0317 family)